MYFWPLGNVAGRLWPNVRVHQALLPYLPGTQLAYLSQAPILLGGSSDWVLANGMWAVMMCS